MATPDWKGLFDWSMKYQDGTKPAGEMKQMKPEDRAWFEEAMQQYTIDVAQHMTKIKQALDAPVPDGNSSEEAVAEKERLLEELLEVVENLDHARDLTQIGGLDTLLSLLAAPQAGLRWRAAEVAGTCVQLNPPVQEWFLKGGALPRFLALLQDADATCRQKGLLAVSCLVRNNPEGLGAFLEAGGAQQLLPLLADESPRVQRKAVQLLAEIAREQPGAIDTAAAQPALQQLADAAEGDPDLREAAGAALAAVANTSSSSSAPGAQTDQQAGQAQQSGGQAANGGQAAPLLLGGPSGS